MTDDGNRDRYGLPTDRQWMSVPEAGAIIGLGRSASYAAARRHDLPTRHIGGRILVIVPAFRRWLEGSDVTPVDDDAAINNQEGR